MSQNSETLQLYHKSGKIYFYYVLIFSNLYNEKLTNYLWFQYKNYHTIPSSRLIYRIILYIHNMILHFARTVSQRYCRFKHRIMHASHLSNGSLQISTRLTTLTSSVIKLSFSHILFISEKLFQHHPPSVMTTHFYFHYQ